MSNYTKLTDFASKDTLPTGNAAKILKGTEIDDEFEAIETAIATKANLDSPALSGTPTAPTAATATDTTQIATTAFVQAALGTVDLSTKADLNGNAAQNFSANSFNGTELVLGNFIIYDSGSYLYVKYGSNNIARLDSSGNLYVEGNIGAYVGV